MKLERNTAYEIDDIVYTYNGTKLLCTVAGTTSTNPFVLSGTTIVDGTVTWTVQSTGGGSSDIVESSYNDTTGSWYRVYTNGWVEQGGFASPVSSDSPYTVTLNKPFKNTKYEIIITNNFHTNTPPSISLAVCGVTNKTTSTFNCWRNSSYTTNVSWYACGMGANS